MSGKAADTAKDNGRDGGKPEISLAAMLQALTIIENEARQARVNLCLAVELKSEAARPQIRLAGELTIPQMDGVSDQAKAYGQAMAMEQRANHHTTNCLGKAVGLAQSLGILSLPVK